MRGLFNGAKAASGSRPRFPIFISLEGKEVLIVGGGRIAARRARVLLEFGAVVAVISPALCRELREISGLIRWKPGRYRKICGRYALVIAATDNRSVNRRVGADAKRMGIPVSVADSREESGFWFPAICESGGLVAGIVSRDANHGAVKAAAQRVRKSLEEGS